MNKTINFCYGGTDYTLEYTRKTVEMMERKGFSATELVDKPMTVFPQLFAGAFLAHHKFARPELIETIHDSLENKEELVNELIEMYNAPIKALIEGTGSSAGNVSWTVEG